MRSTPVQPRWALPLATFVVSLVAHAWWLKAGGPNGRTAFPRDPAFDEGTVLFEALRLSEGDVMYRDFFAFQGPVFSLMNAAAFRVFGFSLVLAQALQLLVNAVSAAFLSIVVSRLAGRIVALSAALVFITVLVPMWPYAYPHWFALLFAHGALVAMTSPSPRPVTFGLAGLCLGLTLWTIQSLGVTLLAGALGLVAAEPLLRRQVGEALRRSAFVAAGAGVATVACLGFFAVNGAVDELWWSMFEWPFRHYRGINTTDYAAFLVDHIDSNRAQPHVWRLISQFAIVFIASLPVAGLVSALVVVAIAARRQWRKVEPVQSSVLLTAATALAALLPIFLAGTRRDVVHLAFVSSFGLVALAALASTLVARSRAVKALTITSFVLAALFTSNFGWKTFRSQTRAERPVDFRSQWLEKFGWAGPLAAATKPGDLVVVGYDGAGGASMLHTQTKSAIAFTYLPFEWRATSDYLSDEQWQRAAREIRERRPRVVAVDSEQWKRLVQLEPSLQETYAEAGPLRQLKETP